MTTHSELTTPESKWAKVGRGDRKQKEEIEVVKQRADPREIGIRIWAREVAEKLREGRDLTEKWLI